MQEGQPLERATRRLQLPCGTLPPPLRLCAAPVPSTFRGTIFCLPPLTVPPTGYCRIGRSIWIREEEPCSPRLTALSSVLPMSKPSGSGFWLSWRVAARREEARRCRRATMRPRAPAILAGRASPFAPGGAAAGACGVAAGHTKVVASSCIAARLPAPALVESNADATTAMHATASTADCRRRIVQRLVVSHVPPSAFFSPTLGIINKAALHEQLVTNYSRHGAQARDWDAAIRDRKDTTDTSPQGGTARQACARALARGQCRAGRGGEWAPAPQGLGIAEACVFL